jgi:hypothetical protein
MQLTHEENIRRGTRVVPFLTWYYSDSILSCTKPQYNLTMLHFGHCATEIPVTSPQFNIEYVYTGAHAQKRLTIRSVTK